MTATAGAQLAMEKMGRVIICVLADSIDLRRGQIISDFAGHHLFAHELFITGHASCEDWDTQVRLFGFTNLPDLVGGERFYSAFLVELPK